MRDAADVVLYVGKAKNLRKRLSSYRVANPDRMPRRQLRLLRAVGRIELESCPDESAALARESELLLSLKPKFNRVGIWPATQRFVVWRRVAGQLELSVTEIPEADWQQAGPMGQSVFRLRAVLARLLWCAVYPGRDASWMPAGWNQGLFPGITRIACGDLADETNALLEKLFAGQWEYFCEWITERRTSHLHAFDQAALAKDVEALKKIMTAQRAPRLVSAP